MLSLAVEMRQLRFGVTAPGGGILGNRTLDRSHIAIRQVD
ncbi:hypothetical protein FHT91_006226 [Rhizobium sp. BK347]|nr:hypothetical protein [Rhizobium sp. BK284]MBB3486405.1 hypothetical protein [Rhizobium sp. BK347]